MLYAFLEIGMTAEDGPVRKCLRSILRSQCRNGAWWCRWWAGYISGTDFVLDAFSRLGLRLGAAPGRGDPLLVQAHRAMEKGIQFVLGSQNPDGGWGETILSDFSPRFAGKGKSRPLHTASALYDLLACGYPAAAPEVKRGYAYLLRTMTPGGRWEDDQVCFTVVPRAVYYADPFISFVLPLNALTAYLDSAGG